MIGLDWLRLEGRDERGLCGRDRSFARRTATDYSKIAHPLPPFTAPVHYMRKSTGRRRENELGEILYLNDGSDSNPIPNDMLK
jgi:hypothetical protein